jgi:hypothetical protein
MNLINFMQGLVHIIDQCLYLAVWFNNQTRHHVLFDQGRLINLSTMLNLEKPMEV